jgi:hypothetical protein
MLRILHQQAAPLQISEQLLQILQSIAADFLLKPWACRHRVLSFL